MDTTQWADGKFTQADYKNLVKGNVDKTLVKVLNDISAKEPSAKAVRGIIKEQFFPNNFLTQRSRMLYSYGLFLYN